MKITRRRINHSPLGKLFSGRSKRLTIYVTTKIKGLVSVKGIAGRIRK